MIIINIVKTFHHIYKTTGRYHLSFLKRSTNTVPFSLELASWFSVCLLDYLKHEIRDYIFLVLFFLFLFHPTQRIAQCPTGSQHYNRTFERMGQTNGEGMLTSHPHVSWWELLLGKNHDLIIMVMSVIFSLLLLVQCTSLWLVSSFSL